MDWLRRQQGSGIPAETSEDIQKDVLRHFRTVDHSGYETQDQDDLGNQAGNQVVRKDDPEDQADIQKRTPGCFHSLPLPLHLQQAEGK